MDFVTPPMKTVTKTLSIGGIALSALAIAAFVPSFERHPIGNSAVPQPARSVDLQRYLGRWYEIARYEQSFQSGCEGVTADYSLRRDGRIGVVNRCRNKAGKLSEVRGIAKIVDSTTNAKLRVSFFRPFYGNYWVLDHADDYSWAIVGEPSGRYLWILARDPTPAGSLFEELIRRVREMGYDTSMLLHTKQP